MPLVHLNLSLDAKQIAENFFTVLHKAFGNFNATDIRGDDTILDFKTISSLVIFIALQPL